MRTLLKTLTIAPGVSGQEDGAADVFSALVSPFCSDIRRDALGNVLAYRRGFDVTKKTIMLEAHTDKIGLMVRHITKDGFLLVAPVGGFDTKLLPATGVRVFGRQTIHGVICAIPPHIAHNEKAPEMDMLCIDTGYSREKLASLVRVGDVLELETEFTALQGDSVAASAMDDRAGLAILVEVLRTLSAETLPVNVVAVASSQEEVGLRGAGVAAYTVNPYAAICIDVCHGKTPDASRNTFSMGGGPVITVGPNVQKCISNALIHTAKSHEIPYQIDVDSGDTGTDAWAVQTVRRGIYTGLLSLPLRYMHSGYEVLNVQDAEKTVALLCGFLKGFGEEAPLCF